MTDQCAEGCAGEKQRQVGDGRREVGALREGQKEAWESEHCHRDKDALEGVSRPRKVSANLEMGQQKLPKLKWKQISRKRTE